MKSHRRADAGRAGNIYTKEIGRCATDRYGQKTESKKDEACSFSSFVVGSTVYVCLVMGGIVSPQNVLVVALTPVSQNVTGFRERVLKRWLR